jgi:hypothetical protein
MRRRRSADGDQQAAAHAKLRGYRAALVRDVTLPDGARVRPGASLTKVWRSAELGLGGVAERLDARLCRRLRLWRRADGDPGRRRARRHD